MGCCSGSSYFPAVDDATTIKDLVEALSLKKKESEEEIKKYTDRLESTTEPELDDESKKKVNERIDFLKNYISSLEEASGILSTNEQMDFQNTQKQIHALYECYGLKDDENGNIPLIINNLHKIVELSASS